MKLWRRLAWAAWAALLLHLAAGLAMVLLLRRGLESNADLADRLSFLQDHRALWTGGWLTWTAAAFSILAFFQAFAAAHSKAGARATPLWGAVFVAVAAVAFDLNAQGIEMSVLPTLIEAPFEFLHQHRVAVLLTGGIANALYTAATWIMIAETSGRYDRRTTVAGYGVVAFGIGLSAAAAADSAAGMVAANAGLVPCIVLWLFGVAKDASLRARA
ncbi:MAG: hypothetical protein HY078_10305 [Elusimicrobia bacterium]|nr:hypothetical protein [Elusimicrobiota bacterium]